MSRAHPPLIALCLALACDRPAPPAAPPPPAPQRAFSIWQDDSIRFYYPEPGRGLVEVRDVDRVPRRWRELVVVAFADGETDGYYVADLRAEPRDEAVATLITAEQLNARAAALGAEEEEEEEVAQVDAGETLLPPSPGRSRKPPGARRADAPSAPAAPAAPAIIIEGLARSSGEERRPMQLQSFDSTSSGVSAAERSRWISEVFSEVNGARRSGRGGCPTSKPASDLARSEPLDRAAQAVALDMARTGNTLREDVRKEVKASGYRGATQGITAEGIDTGRGFATKYLEDQARCNWLRSGAYKALGVGTARSKSGHYWVMILGSST